MLPNIDRGVVDELRGYVRANRSALDPFEATTLIQGETGTGKELVARAIHGASARASQPFVVIDCAGLSPGLIESDLFGHVRGAFTGAIQNRAGLFEAGSGGTATLSPTCDAEPGDENDPCTQCMKQNCCDAWRACNDETCVAEWGDVAECVLMEEFADSETLGECISQSSAAMDDFVQQNTTELISCATASADDAGFETLCSSECFGTDIFFE